MDVEEDNDSTLRGLSNLAHSVACFQLVPIMPFHANVLSALPLDQPTIAQPDDGEEVTSQTDQPTPASPAAASVPAAAAASQHVIRYAV